MSRQSVMARGSKGNMKVQDFLGIVCFSILFLFVGVSIRVSATPHSHSATPFVQPTPEKGPAYVYKAIPIGTLADDVRKKLGEPKDKTDEQDLYVFSDEESVQFMYDAGKKVTAIMITFSGKLTGAPTAKDVFGEEVPAKADGGVFKMVRYPKAGYWISYNKIAGDDAMISIAMQKI